MSDRQIAISITLTPSVLARLDRLAAHLVMSRSACADRVLGFWLPLIEDELPPRDEIIEQDRREGRTRADSGGAVSALVGRTRPAASTIEGA
jgi:predicted transcriptional regulator